jgi:hypothetical protein
MLQRSIRSFMKYMSLIVLSMLFSCQKEKVVQTSFYYWKTVYELNNTEKRYVDSLHCKKLYIRLMDIDVEDNNPRPISPISFKSKIPDSVEIVPVVFIVNQVLKGRTQQQVDDLVSKIAYYVSGKVKQSGKADFKELQIDCDWTRTTRENYFYLLQKLRLNPYLKNKTLTATLRLHQLKNIKNSGIPPVNRVMLMCYNMGNLRKYGTQNSILEQSELEKYMNDNLGVYPIPIDVGLPLFNWAVVFRKKEYVGIAKRLQSQNLLNKRVFKQTANNIYRIQEDLPMLGLKRNDEVRWEAISVDKLNKAGSYIQKYITSDTVNLIYFHLDELTLQPYTWETLKKTATLFN